MKLQAALLILMLSIVPAYAQKSLNVLTTAETDPGHLLPPPPAADSELQKKELAEVAQLVKTRAPERFAQAKWDNEHEDATAFAAVIGPGFDLSRLPITAKLLDVILNDQAVVASAAKALFQRKSPVAATTPTVVAYENWTCDKNPKDPAGRAGRAYPSGHVTMGYTLGIVLSALIPEKAQPIMARAADYAYSREVCGDHYHSDIEAGHALGNALGIMLLNSAALQPQIAASKAELRAAHLTVH